MGGCLHHFFEAAARRSPGAVAVAWDGGRLTYGELDRRSDGLARALLGAGAGADRPVAIDLARSPELVTAVLAVLKAGAACLPLDRSFPRARLGLVLDDAGAEVLLAGADVRDPFPGRGLRVLRPGVDSYEDGGAPLPAVDPDQLAYVVFTSGSTGRPKGVAMPHRAVANLVAWQARHHDPGPGSRTLQFAPIAFDVAFQELFTTWATGGTLVLIGDDERRDPRALSAFLERRAVHRVFLPPVALERLAEATDGAAPGPLRQVIAAGEALVVSPAIARLCAGGVSLHNHYGPSETHVVTAEVLAGRPEGWPARPPIGRPVDGCRVRLLGEPAELFLGGAGLARGYLGRPAATAAAFVPDPDAREPGARLYRSGDLGRRTPAGALVFLGRRDGQLKVRGFRVEPGEVEAVLGGHPSVRRAVVGAWPTASGERRLVAWVLPRGDNTHDLGPELRRFLGERLPEPMLPDAWVLLDDLPLLPTGKVDRGALPAPDWRRPDARPAPPRTPVEEELLATWRRVLGDDLGAGLGVDDDVFERGGHSLNAAQVISRIRRTLNVEVSLSEVFAEPTVAGLARRVEGKAVAPPATTSPAEPELVPRAAGETAPAAFAQERLLFLDHLLPGHPAYNVATAFELRGDLDVAALGRALGGVVGRHEALRTVFVPGPDGRPRQVVGPAPPGGVGVVDVAALDDPEAELRRLLAAEARRPFDLGRGPLWRAFLVALPGRRHVFFLALHHVVVDGWSESVLTRELGALYAGATLAPLEVQYPDFALWQERWLGGGRLERQLGYWRTHLAGLDPLELPADRPRLGGQSGRAGTVRLSVPADLAEGLAGLGRRHGASLFMTLLAGFTALLGRLTGRRDLAVGAPIANRPRPELEDLVGFFVNSVVLRADLAGDPSFAVLLERTRRTALDAFAHQDVPFARLVEEVAPEREALRNPLYDVAFALHNTPRPRLDLTGLGTRRLDLAEEWARFDLELDFEETGAGLEGRILYRRALYDPTRIARLARHLEGLLGAAAADPERRLSELSLLQPAERHQLLAEWNDPPSAAPRAATLDEPFFAWAERAPSAVAVAGRGFAVGYGRLACWADGLARRLRERGVGPETRVGLTARRSPEMVAGVLAILRAGGAYVPLDPTYPAERLAAMADDARIALRLVGPGHDPLEGHPVPTLELTEDTEATAPATPLPPPALGNAAYVLFTSGSTGRPKGVVTSHVNAVHSTAARLAHYRRAERFLLLSPLAFDSSVAGLFGTLSSGGTLWLVSEDEQRDPVRLADAVAEGRVTALLAVPALWQLLLETAPAERLQSLRTVIVAGESCPPGLVERHLRALPRAELWNEYGPTEATVWATAERLGTPGPVAIGRPVAGAGAWVLGPRLEPVPLGVPGELFLGGPGLARGYDRRPRETALRFVPHPFAAAPGERLYRTGDLAVHRPDGALLFVGRRDQQVKLRGFRIELGEVEKELEAHPAVGRAVVEARGDDGGNDGGERRLVAHVVPATGDAPEASWRGEHVDLWRSFYDGLFADGTPATDGAFDTTGWVSSYDERPLPREHLRRWVDHTVERVLSLGPRRVLEIGCGSGLLLFRIAPHCESYLGTDFSRAVVDRLEEALERSGGEPRQARLSRRPADDFTGLPAGSFDTVVLNSVIQYFPDAGYLLRVLRRAVEATAPGGSVFVGDVRSLPLLEAFCASVELHQAGPGLAADELRRRIGDRVRRQKELLVDPAFFTALARELPRVRQVRVLPKAGRDQNELTRFRYDVFLHLDREAVAPAEIERLGWTELGTLEALRRHLDERRPEALRLDGVPNARVAREVDLLERLPRAPAAAVEPEDLRDLGTGAGYTVELSGADRTFEALFSRTPGVRLAADAAGPALPWSAYTNDPLRERADLRLAASLGEWLRRRLPEHMVPSAFVVQGELPLLPNGKVDRRVLARSGRERRAGVRTPPRGPVEEALAGIWGRLLGVEGIGAGDNFFELGGHSLLAARVVAAIREAFSVELPVLALFEEPTLAGLAREVAAVAATDDVPEPLVRVPRDGVLPLSFAQERAWFLDRLEPGTATSNTVEARRLLGDLDRAALERALAEVVRRHEVLRTVLPEVDGRPRQVVRPFTGQALPLVDLRHLPAERRRREARRAVAREAGRPFDLAQGPLLRPCLLRLGRREHVFLVVVHHVVFDAWSEDVLFRELEAAYAGAELPEPAIQYADYAAWQRRRLRGPRLEDLLRFWRRRLDGLEPLRLPTDRPRPASRSCRGAALPLAVPAALRDRLEAVSLESGGSLYMTLLAALALLLGRTGGEGDLGVGSPVANRDHEGTAGLVGFFVNTLVLRVALPAGGSFRDLLGGVRETALAAYAHQDLPFDKLVEELAPDRDARGNPLVRVLLTLHNAPRSELSLPGLAVGPFATPPPATRFDLSWHLARTEAGLAGRVVYDADLFDATTVDRLARRFVRLLGAAAADPGRPLDELDAPEPHERHQLLVEWNDRRRGFDGPSCLHHLFLERAARTPGAVALTAGGEEVTYGELRRRAGRLAGGLAAAGIGRGTIVGVDLERGVDLVAALLAVLETGAAYLPLDPRWPAARRRALLDDAGAALCLTDAVAPAPRPGAVRRPGEAGGGDPAYVIYTSGSTGKPKGVVVSHRAAVNRLLWGQEAYPLDPGDAVLQLASPAFDFSVWEVFAPLMAGARVVLVPASAGDDLAALVDLAAGAGVTVAHFTPSFLEALCELPGLERWTSLRRVFSGGEALPAAVAERFRRRSPAVLDNQYGPTEAAIDVTWHGGAGPRGREVVPLGRPIANTEVHVVGPGLRPVPLGAWGEIALAGTGLALGYHRRPAATAERFVPHPSGSRGERLYLSGDRGRFLPDGVLEVAGRLDRQVQVRGVRVEPGEVEAALAALPGVRSAAVVPQGSGGGVRLAAFYVPRGAPDDAELRRALGERLPRAMVPAVFVALAELPRTVQGKVDRAALARRDADRAVPTAPRTPVEEMVAEVWSEVLGRQEVGAHDDFFELGGHSLLATQVVARIRRLTGVELEVRALFEDRTPAALAGRVEAARPGAAVPVLEPRGAACDDLPLSFAQERLWFLDRLEGPSAAYNMPRAWHLEGDLDAPALEAALEAVARRHETLRTRFPSVAGTPRQVIDPPSSRPLPRVDIAALEPPRRAAETARLLAREAVRPFDLERETLWRALLVRRSDGDHTLFAVHHHAVFDGWSAGVLEEELGALYRAFRGGERTVPPAPRVQYADYALWQRGWLRGEALERLAAAWRERLAGLVPLELPTDRPRPAEPSFRGAAREVEIPAAVTADLRRLGREAGASLYMTLLAAWSALLGRLSGQDGVAVGSPVAHRRQQEVEGLIGFFVNTLVLDVDLSGDPPWRELLARARETALFAYGHQDLPFEKLVAELRPRRDLGRHPLFQVLLAFQNTPRRGLELADLETTPAEVASSRVRFDLELHLWEDGGTLRGALLYATDLFDAVTIGRLLRSFAVFLAAAGERPEARLGALPVLGRGERHQLLHEWQGATPSPAGTVTALVAAAARRSPRAVAVRRGTGELTYGDLLDRAGRLARRLRALGVGPETPVAVACGRTAALAVAVLGVLEAGGVVVPLDPADPPRRRSFVLADAAVAAAVTEAGSASWGVPQVELDAAGGLADGGDDVPAAPPEIGPEHLAYLVYTSGSTGRPKGVAMRHGALANLVAWHLRQDPRPRRTLQFAALSFDVAFQETFVTWAAGGTLVMVDEAVRRDPAALVRVLAEEAVERLFLPFAALVQLAAAPPGAETTVRPAALREVITAGEQLRAGGEVRRLFAGLPGARLHNHYGPSETHVVSAETLAGPPAAWPALPPIGRPIDGVRTLVLAPRLEPAPPGAAGELALGGACLARGYWRRPALTAERFVPDPFASEPGARLYLSGDLARHRADGRLEFLGRRDRQVKVRGFRVEPGEVEAALEEHPGIAEAVVVTAPEAGGGRRLVAFLRPRGPEPPARELAAHLGERLPAPFVPSSFAAVDAWPKTASGKVDRDALGRRAADLRPASEAVFEAPRSVLERTLTEVYGEVLERPEVSRGDDFFALGGHSLLAVRLLARIAERTGVELPLATLFRGATVADLAAALAEGRPGASPLVAIRTAGEGPPFFAVHPGGGHVLCYAELARRLGDDRPFYGLTARGYDGEAPFDEDVETMAERYLGAVREVEPSGPYCLGGWSMGGLVAWEMARRLREEGREVALLALFDTAVPVAGQNGASFHHFARDLGLPPSPALAELRGDEGLERLLADARRAGLLEGGADLARARHLYRLFTNNLRAMRRYRPPAFAGRVVVFRPEAAAGPDPSLGWADLATGGVERVTVSGDHWSMVREPHVAVLAERLSRALDDVTTRQVY